jgi:hypothetical protein
VATIQDIANQVNNTLTQINQNTQDTANTLGLIKGDTADIKTRIDTLNSDLSTRLDNLIAINQAGFLFLGQGLFLILEQIKRSNSLLEGQIAQNDAMLCWFRQIADLLCRSLQRQNTQVALQTEIEADLDKVRKLLEAVHCCESADIDRLAEIEARLRACCPPVMPRPEACPEPCASPRIDPYEPKDDPDWQVPRSSRNVSATLGTGVAAATKSKEKRG